MTFRWWMAPVIGVGLCAVANAVLITTAVRVRPQKVVDRPYEDSRHEDRLAAERDGFAERGWTIAAAVDGTGCTLTFAGGAAEAGVVAVYRPDDRASDRRLAWADPAQPLRIDLPRPGPWSLVAEFRHGDATVTRALRVERP